MARVILFLLLFLITLFLNITGKIFYFIHPRFLIYSVFSTIMFLVLFLFEFYRLIKNKDEGNNKIFPYLMFFIFILSVSFYKFEDTSKNIAQNKEINYKSPVVLKTGSIDGEVLEVDEKNYLYVLEELNSNTEDYIGREIKIDGFVFRDKDFKQNQFVVARLFVTCCAADAQVLGLMVEGNFNAGDNQWVRVEGVIGEGMYKGEKIPTIKAKTIKTIQKPSTEYIYP